MARTHPSLSPALQRIARSFGERLQLARNRRKLSATLFAERIGVSRNTLQRVEDGDPGVSLGTYLRALRVLGLEDNLDALARDDELGRKLQDMASMGGLRGQAPAEPHPSCPAIPPPPRIRDRKKD
ncbi:DNA-binding XRE family transcriptional regulator [Microvirgula sp. AG722]|uniref:XRE family transcriptional regulator n=1 Tax=Microvirgula aerodenitrificans TaxID=57480 RepID=A0A2S0P8V0_9NEIS|nr:MULTISPECIES: helix-turn-helix transcriptional regulator [Microvirgula]AVY93786.1 XRE family transcriptional regulator [Microvirgula aerodenitrificans]RAS14266.1 DNA-binding XRE family transcriptional regulator [Microvirgula sp. AG722]